MGKPTKAEMANCEAGNCTKCGKFDQFRNTAGQCMECHNAGYHAYKKERKIWLEQQRQQGREFWASQGITPGDKVERFARSMLGFGGIMVRGTAKVGAPGAYVSAPQFQPGYLTCHGWRKATE